MIPLHELPAVNATLNGVTAILLATGYAMIRRRRVAAHRACMIGALCVSVVFLASYLYYHAHVGSKPFPGRGWIRPAYFAMLISHTVLAAAILPLALTTLYRGLSGKYAKHVRLARWTLPLWLYVSLTGILVYLLLYQVYS